MPVNNPSENLGPYRTHISFQVRMGEGLLDCNTFFRVKSLGDSSVRHVKVRQNSVTYQGLSQEVAS